MEGVSWSASAFNFWCGPFGGFGTYDHCHRGFFEGLQSLWQNARTLLTWGLLLALGAFPPECWRTCFWSCIVLLVGTSLFNHTLDADEAPFKTTVRDDDWLKTASNSRTSGKIFVSLGLGIA